MQSFRPRSPSSGECQIIEMNALLEHVGIEGPRREAGRGSDDGAI